MIFNALRQFYFSSWYFAEADHLVNNIHKEVKNDWDSEIGILMRQLLSYQLLQPKLFVFMKGFLEVLTQLCPLLKVRIFHHKAKLLP